MKRYVFLHLLSALALITVGCQRNIDGDLSTIEILTPSSLQTIPHQKTGALEAYPQGRTLCYFVNVTAPDIESKTKAICSPKMGIFSQMVPGGKSLTLSVPRGSARSFELFVFLAAAGSTTCPEVAADLKPSLIKDTYLAGTTYNVSLSNSEENIVIQASFPGLSNNIVKQLNMPASCNPAGFPSARISLAQGTATGGKYKITARVGSPSEGSVLTGGKFKIKVNSVSK